MYCLAGIGDDRRVQGSSPLPLRNRSNLQEHGKPRYMICSSLMRQFEFIEGATLIVSEVDDEPIVGRW